MSDETEFMGLALDDEMLCTPEGTMPLHDLTRAEFVRDVVKDGHEASTTQPNAGAVAGGAIVGGALLGVPGAIGGGLLGSTVHDEAEGAQKYKTNSVQLVFETDSASFRMDIPREQETAAYDFARKVEAAMKAHRG